VAVTGHKSGRQITVPVNYFQEDSTLYITSSRGRMWWHNLRGSTPVTVHFQGKDIKGSGMLVDERGAVLQGLKRWFQKSPNAAQALGVRLDANGQPNLHDMSQLAQDRVLVKVSFKDNGTF
jgi:nitroimidazol reductase NimA-like FMN-containing flavoprotein (pyridoxamine 5'-phosphate oxidase superfamily)